jgi:hypothetical protein
MGLLDLYASAKLGPWQTAGLGVQYRIEWNGNDARLFFQYTASVADWIFNFFFWPLTATPYRDQPIAWRAHGGLATLWQSARDEIIPKVIHAERVTVAGISQGGALAVLAHEDLVFRRGAAGIDSYAFAAPRVLWLPPSVVRERFAGLTLIHRRGDIVTMLPPWAFGYQHVGTKQKIGNLALPWWTHHRFEEYEEALS